MFKQRWANSFFEDVEGGHFLCLDIQVMAKGFLEFDMNTC